MPRKPGAKLVAVLCHPPVRTLFATLGGAHGAYAFDHELPVAEWDYRTPPLSIPFHCGTRLDAVPASLPDLGPDPENREAWAYRLALARRAR